MLEWEKNGQPPGKSRKPWFLQPKNRAPVPWLWQKRIRLIRLGFYSTGVMGLMEYYMEQYRTITEMIMWNTNGQWIICSWGRDKRVTRQYEKWTIYRCFITHIYIYKYILKMLVFHSYSKIQFPEGSWSLPACFRFSSDILDNHTQGTC
jgi:hypothetical protein